MVTHWHGLNSYENGVIVNQKGHTSACPALTGQNDCPEKGLLLNVYIFKKYFWKTDAVSVLLSSCIMGNVGYSLDFDLRH